MPGMTGVALASAVTQLRPGMPVLLCTGFSDDLLDHEIAAAGIRAVVNCPQLRHGGRMDARVAVAAVLLGALQD